MSFAEDAALWGGRRYGAASGGLLQPCVELAGLTEKLDPGLVEAVVSIDDGEGFFTFGEAGVLLVFGAERRGVGVGGRGVELSGEGVELLAGELLLEAGYVGGGMQDFD